MSFKKIELATPQGEGETPWISQLLTSNPEFNGRMFQVRVVAFSQRGVMITTEYFKAFLYRSNPYYSFLLDALRVWTTNNLPVHALMVMTDINEKSRIHIGVEDSLESNWEKKSETLFKLKLGLPDFLPTPIGQNPLLVVSSSTATPKGKGRRGKAGKGGQASVARKAAESLANAFPGSEMMEDSSDDWDDPEEAPSA